MVVDESRESLAAAEAAVELVAGTGSELHVVHVVSTVLDLPYPRRGTKARRESLLEAKKLRGLRLLDQWVGWIGGIGGRVAGSYYREGRPEEEVVRLAEEIDAGLVVAGDRRPDWLDRFLPTFLSGGILRRSNRPVLVVRGPVKASQKVPRQG